MEDYNNREILLLTLEGNVIKECEDIYAALKALKDRVHGSATIKAIAKVCRRQSKFIVQGHRFAFKSDYEEDPSAYTDPENYDVVITRAIAKRNGEAKNPTPYLIRKQKKG